MLDAIKVFCTMIAAFLFAIFLVHSQRPLVIVLNPGESGIVERIEDEGYRVQVLAMPCDGDLNCWAKHVDTPAYFNAWLQQELAPSVRQGAVVVGISRGGYLALAGSCLPGVQKVAVLSPVTDLSRLREFGEVHESYKLKQPCADTYSTIGANDVRVGTDATLALLPQTVITMTPGHELAGVEGMLKWLK